MESFGNAGEIIRTARKKKKISAEKLGLMLDPQVTSSAVTAWERGQNKPSVEVIRQICDALEIDARSFYNQSSVQYCYVNLDDPMRKDMETFEDCYTRMTDTQRKAVLAVASAMVDC